MKQLLILLSAITFSISSYSQWTQTSGPTGGNTIQLTSVSDYLFVNGEVGGIFRSADNGATWVAVNNGLPDYPHCYSFTAQGDSIYAAIYGNGLFYSNDFGENWVAINNGIETITTYSIAVKGSYIFLGWSEGGIYVSSDHGSTWAHRNGPVSGQVTSLAISNGTLFASATSIYKSDDKGATWTMAKELFDGNNQVVAYNDTLYVLRSPLLVSTNGGESWDEINFGSLNIRALYAENDEIYIAGSDGETFYSDDAGSTWTGYYDPEVNSAGRGLLKHNASLFMATDDGVFHSTDNGATWSERNNGLINQVINYVAIDGSTIVAAGFSGLSTSNDNGVTWTKADFGTPNDPVIDLYTNDDSYFVSLGREIYQSSDQGVTWTMKYATEINHFIGVIRGDGNNIMATINGIGIAVSADAGETWELKSSTIFENANLVSGLVLGDTIIAGADNAIYISKNGGDDWEISEIPASHFTPNSIYYYNSKLLVLTYAGLYESADFGASWTNIHMFPTTLEPNSLTIREDGTFYVTASKTIQVSYDGGEHWYSVDKGIENIPNYALAITADYFFVGTYGQSVWRAPVEAVNVAPEITDVNQALTITEGESIEILPSFFTIDDPDNSEFTIEVLDGENYNVSENLITPLEGFFGELTVNVIATDGNFESETFSFTIEVTQIVGVEETASKSEFYPNPVRDVLFVKNANDVKSFTIHDQLGRVIRKDQLPGKSLTEIRVSDLPPGSYFLKIEGSKKVKRVIKY